MAKSGFAKEILQSFIARVERLEEEKAALVADIREVYAEAKGTGFDTKIMRQVVRMRKLDKADFQEQQAILDLYLDAVGMQGLPLGDYAERAPAKQTTKEFAGKAPLPLHNSETGEITEPEQDGGTVIIGDKDAPKASVVAMNAHDYKRTIVATIDLAESLPAHMRRTKPPPQPVT